jgi:hypothetical protein
VRRRPVEVIVQRGKPRRFRWRGRWYPVTGIREVWQDAGEWWAGEAPAWYWRIASGTAWFELASDLSGRHWWVYRVYD